jgi:hypothetical protein
VPCISKQLLGGSRRLVEYRFFVLNFKKNFVECRFGSGMQQTFTGKEKAMGRRILAIVVGVIVGGIVVFAVESISHLIYPPPTGVDMNDKEAMKAYVAMLPIGALLFVLLAYVLGSLAGGWAAAKFARDSNLRLSMTVGAVLLLFGIMNLVMIPHPLWFAVLSILVFLPAAYLGGKLGAKLA